MDPKVKEQLKKEFKLLEDLVQTLYDDAIEDGLELIKTHYKDSQHAGAWLKKICEDSDQADVLMNINAVVISPFEQEQKVRVTFSGAEDTPYNGQEYFLDFDVPDDFPEVPLECYIEEEVYHLNVL